MPADRSETYQLQTQQGNWPGALPVQKGHVTFMGKVYPTVKLPDGNVWMAQNLAMVWDELAILRNYSDVPTDMMSCAFWEFDQTHYGDRGLFYNASARSYLQRTCAAYCPGWHVPTSSELESAMRFAVNTGDVFGFGLNVCGYGIPLSTSENRGWYESTISASNYSKAYYLQHSADNPSYCFYHYVAEDQNNLYGPYSGQMHYTYDIHMPIRLVMDDPSQFVPETTEYTNIRTEYTRYWRPQVTFEFSESDFTPVGKGLLNSRYSNGCKWTKVSNSPNRWTLEVSSKNHVVSDTDQQYGLAFLCNSQSGNKEGLLTPTQLGTCTCKIVGFGTMDNIETMDRSFFNCTSLTQIPTSITFGNYIANVAQMFAGCTEVTGGALSLYNQLKDVATITNHADTFKDCGLNTVTGLAELQQIPLSWGGLLAPPSTTMTCTRKESSNPKVKWSCGSTAPDWSTNPELYVFTSESVSDYAGVNMKRSNTTNIQNNFATSGVPAYYRIAFVQFDSGSSGAITWCLTTSGYNGMLDASSTAGDMPGTLSYDNYGSTDLHYGTYDSSKDVFFGFLVTNAAPDSWQGLTDAYALQGNNFYHASQDVKWFIEE